MVAADAALCFVIGKELKKMGIVEKGDYAQWRTRYAEIMVPRVPDELNEAFDLDVVESHGLDEQACQGWALDSTIDQRGMVVEVLKNTYSFKSGFRDNLISFASTMSVNDDYLLKGAKLPAGDIDELKSFRSMFDAETGKFSSPEAKKEAISFLKR